MENHWKELQEQFLEGNDQTNQQRYHIPEEFFQKDPWISKYPEEIFLNWRELGLSVQDQFPKETGEELQSLFEQKEYLLGIHRTREPNVKIFSEGIKVMSGSYDSEITTIPYFPLILHQIYHCKAWKDSIGVFLILLPKEQKTPIYYYKKENEKNQIYDYPYLLLPEYIYGFLPVNEGNIGSIIMNPNFRFFHDLRDEENYRYDDVLPQKKGRR